MQQGETVPEGTRDEPAGPSDRELEAPEEATTAGRKRKFSQNRLELIQADYERRGVVYISYIPRKLKPRRLKLMLGEFGDIGRIYLSQEDPAARRRRKRKVCDTTKRYTEGWVEFLDKKTAKRVARMLNGQPMGGKRRSPFYSSLWSLKYLPKFKWEHLREEITYQRATYAQRLAQELRNAKREREFYLTQVDRANYEERKSKRAQHARQGNQDEQKNGNSQHGATHNESQTVKQKPMKGLRFHQREAIVDPLAENSLPEVSNDIVTLLMGNKASDDA